MSDLGGRAQIEGCRCQECGWHYKVDVLVPNHIWEQIKPLGKPEGAGLMCGACIMQGIERLGHFAAYQLDLKS